MKKEAGRSVSNEKRWNAIREAFTNVRFHSAGMEEACVICQLFRSRTREVIDLCRKSWLPKLKDKGDQAEALDVFKEIHQALMDDFDRAPDASEDGYYLDTDSIKQAFFFAFDREIQIIEELWDRLESGDHTQ